MAARLLATFATSFVAQTPTCATPASRCVRPKLASGTYTKALIQQTAQFQESKYFANVYSQDADIVYERCSLTGTTSAQCAQTTNPGPSEVVTSFSLAAPGGLSNYAPVPVTAGSASIIQTLTDCLAGITPASSTGTSSEPTSVGERPEDSPSNSGTEQSSSNNGGSSSSGGSGGLSTGAAVGLGVAVAAMSLGLATYAFFFYRSHFRHWRSMWARRKGGIVQSDKANHGEAGYGGQYGYGYERPPEQAELHHDPRPYELAQSGGTAGRSELGASISGPHELPGAAEFQAASELHGTSRK
jgi:hypothetical protein